MFLYQGWYLHKGKETSYLTSSVANFGQKATSLFEIWTPAQSSASTSRFHKGFFSFLDRIVLFLSSFRLFLFLFVFVFVFFYQGLSSAFGLSMSKDFSINKELPHVNFVCARYKKNKEIILKLSLNMSGCRENRPGSR